MKLSKTERLLLSNQYKILQNLYPEDVAYYKEAQDIVDEGYELFYDLLTSHISHEPLNNEQCREVLDILTMYRILYFSYRDLEDKTEIDKTAIQFDGFDGNHEINYLSFAQFLIFKQGKFAELAPQDQYTDLNSHSEKISSYRKMLKEWQKINKRNRLTKEDIQRITKAQNAY